MIYHYTIFRVANINILKIPNASEDTEQEGLSFSADKDAKWHIHGGRLLGSFFIKLNRASWWLRW